MPLRSSLALLLLLPLLALAQAKKKDPPPEKKGPTEPKVIAEDAMKKSDVKDANMVETEGLVVASVLPEAKARTMAESLQKTYALASKALKLDDAGSKAKIIIYCFAEVDQFRQFQRTVLKTRPEDEYAIHEIRRDVPFIAISAHRGEKNPNFEQLAADEICRAMLAKKESNARVTEWMKDGFARAVQWRLNPTSASGDRAAVFRIAPRLGKTAKGMPVVDKAWSGSGKEKDQVAASFMDYLTFGTGNDKLGNILNGLIPTGRDKDPTFMEALKAGEIVLEDLDRSWRDWVAKGSPAAK
jgi:hypothetical protein